MQPNTSSMSPEQQAFVNNWLKASQAAVQQPTAQLQETQAAAGAAGQSTATSAQEQANLQAANPGIQANTQSEQITALQKQAPLSLSKDIAKGITLSGALTKYKGLGMSSDQIFSQYLSSPYGTPHETPEKLQALGVSPDALGKIGTPGSFMDKYNTKNAIQELRNLEDLWNQTGTTSKLPFLSGSTPAGKAYQSSLQVVGEHLSSLIPGASSSQGSNNALLNALPQLGDLSELNPDTAKGQFNAIEKQLLASKGYSYDDLGLATKIHPGSSQSSVKPTAANTLTGNGLINTLLGSAINTANDIGTGARNMMEGPTLHKQEQMALQLEQQAANTTDPAARGLLLKRANDLRGGVASESNDIGRSFSPDVNKNYADRALTGATQIAGVADLPSLLLGGKNKLMSIINKGGSEAVAAASTGLPSALKTFINPKGAISQAGGVRDALIDTASKAGTKVDGDSLLSSITNWSQKAKMGNLGQGKAIDTAVSDAESLFKGKHIDPKDIMEAYREADSGFTSSGIPKTPIQANIDRGLRDIFSKYLDKAAPGWQNSTTSMAKAYRAQKSPIRAGVKNIAKFGIPIAAGAEGGNLINQVLFGGHK